MELVYVQFIVNPEIYEKRRSQAGRKADQIYDERALEAFEASVNKYYVMLKHIGRIA
jgi:hypothetical protein